MFCPQCGQQQVSETVRYCSRCGFLLETVSLVLASAGKLPARYAASSEQSPRSKGVRQGGMLMLSTLLVVPVVTILTVTLTNVGHILVPLAAILCFVGGLLRMLYALLMEDASPPIPAQQLTPYAPPIPAQLPNRTPAATLSAPTWNPRPNTAEIFTPPSVTENTTRLLKQDESKES